MGAKRKKPRPPLEVGHFEEAAVSREAEDEYQLPEVEYPFAQKGSLRVREAGLWALPGDAFHADRIKVKVGAGLDALRELLGAVAMQRDEVVQLRESTRAVLGRLSTV